MNHYKPSRIISGGQTGVDQAGIDVALDLGIDYGGSIPSGRRTEDGYLSRKYTKMKEVKSRHYQVRTEKNVMDSDATIIFTYNRMGSGSALTIKKAEEHLKSCLHVNLDKQTDDVAVRIVTEWLDSVRPSTLNVAGSRESAAQGIYQRVFNIMKKVLGD